MNKQIIAFSFSLQIFMTVFGQNKTLPVFEGKATEVNTGSFKARFRHFISVRIESEKLSEFVRRNAVSSFHLNLGSEKNWDIDLEPSNIATSDYHLKIITPEGIQTLPSAAGFLYKGKVRGSNGDEQVRLTIKEGFIYGSIQAGGKEYFIEPLSRFPNAKEKDQYIVYEASDVISNESLSCGVQDKELSLEETKQQNVLKQQSPLDVVCKKIKFISVADYSMYQKFGNDVSTVETILLSILNLAEGAFTTLNLGADGSTDIGTDRLQFEMEEIVVSTCSECDMAPGIENASTIGNNLLNWASKNIDQRAGKIIQHWTIKSIFDITGKGLAGTIAGPFNCSGMAGEILHYGTDDLSFLRVLVAHETGHALGCPHDNDVKADVRGFIMYSSANENSMRFSTLADFGGVNYSSQQTIRNTILTTMSCLAACGNSSCEEAKDLEIDYGNFNNDVRFNWSGNGNYLVKYKVNDSAFYDPANIRQTNLNSLSLKGLEPCTLYKFEIQRNCGAEYSRASSIIFKTSSLSVSTRPTNIHGDQYDLELNLDCKNCTAKEYFIKIDAKPYKVSNNNSLKKILFKDLFADGARHRMDISKDSGNLVCTATSFYTAPYYRSNYTKLLDGNFNDCSLPARWKDSLLAKRSTSAPDAHWLISQQNFFASRAIRGSLDSTCMIYLSTFNNAYSGALSLTSPRMDLTKYSDIKLHYDYNFLGYKFSTPVGSITVEAFDGTGWQKIAERQGDAPASPLRNIWDSMPQRVFIDLDKYQNKDFQLRFTVDDGSLVQRATLGVFVAFDNIVVDGYLKDSAVNKIIVYPNPTNNEVFIQFSQQPVSEINYRLIDVAGRIMIKGILNNYRINVNKLSRGMYLLELYENEELLTTRKVLKQ